MGAGAGVANRRHELLQEKLQAEQDGRRASLRIARKRHADGEADRHDDGDDFDRHDDGDDFDNYDDYASSDLEEDPVSSWLPCAASAGVAPQNELHDDRDSYFRSLCNNNDERRAEATVATGATDAGVAGPTHEPLSDHADEVDVDMDDGQRPDVRPVVRVEVGPGQGKYTLPADTKRMMELYELCDKKGVPRHFMDQVLKIMQSHDGGINMESSVPSRKAFVTDFMNTFRTSRPKVVKVMLENTFSKKDINYHRGRNNLAHVITFDFMEQLVDLLSDESVFGDLKNLVVNREDRWKPYCPPE